MRDLKNKAHRRERQTRRQTRKGSEHGAGSLAHEYVDRKPAQPLQRRLARGLRRVLAGRAGGVIQQGDDAHRRPPVTVQRCRRGADRGLHLGLAAGVQQARAGADGLRYVLRAAATPADRRQRAERRGRRHGDARHQRLQLLQRRVVGIPAEPDLAATLPPAAAAVHRHEHRHGGACFAGPTQRFEHGATSCRGRVADERRDGSTDLLDL